MESEFWLEKWASNQIGFHRKDSNPLLVKYWPELGVTQGSGVFVPLCGKSLDMRYLESLGHPVFGVEFSETAAQAYFAEADESFDVSDGFYLRCYKGTHTTLYVGDFFDVHVPDILGIRGVYDRGALVALPPALRSMYVDHLLRIVPEHAHILLITLEYDQDGVAGPPFSVTEAEIAALYEPRARWQCIGSIETTELPPKFSAAGIESAREAIYHIVKEH